jgi:hypothetical protein
MTGRLNIAVLLIAGLPLTAGAAAGAQGASVVNSAGTVSPLSNGKERVLNEVLVPGTPLWKLRQKMVEVEDQFYALYNQVNKDKDFDVHCHIETPTGRIIKERACRVAFIEDAQAVEVQAMLDGHSAPPADMVALAREADFEQHFLQVVNSDKRLLKLVREREALGKKYDERHAEMARTHHWFRFEK